MYDTVIQLNKIEVDQNDADAVLATTVMADSFAERWPRYRDMLSWSGALIRFNEAQKRQHKNKQDGISILSRITPRRQKTVTPLSRNTAVQYGGDQPFDNRNSGYASPLTIFTKFSLPPPLTCLYLDSRSLHDAANGCHPDNCRPDMILGWQYDYGEA